MINFTSKHKYDIYVGTSFLFGSLGVHSIMSIAQCSEQAKGNIWKNYRQHKHIETIDDFDEVDFFMIFVLQKGFANPITPHQIRGKGIGIFQHRCTFYIIFAIQKTSCRQPSSSSIQYWLCNLFRPAVSRSIVDARSTQSMRYLKTNSW